jgi:hypothetical protein
LKGEGVTAGFWCGDLVSLLANTSWAQEEAYQVAKRSFQEEAQNMKKHHLLLVIPAFLLQACSTTPAPMLSDYQYQQFGAFFATIDRCGVLGYTSPEVVAYGKIQMNYQLNSYSYYPERLRSAMTVVSSILDKGLADSDSSKDSTMTKICNGLAMRVAEMRQQQQINAANAQAEQQAMQNTIQSLQNSTPKTTYCNSFGSQTSCTTY